MIWHQGHGAAASPPPPPPGPPPPAAPPCPTFDLGQAVQALGAKLVLELSKDPQKAYPAAVVTSGEVGPSGGMAGEGGPGASHPAAAAWSSSSSSSSGQAGTFVSPLSAFFALAMCLNGAGG